jgi:hypothetical protein
MTLLELYRRDPAQFAAKHLQQIIVFAADGKLGDGTPASAELRDFLAHVPSSELSRFAGQCLADSFPESGFALQDIVNEIGSRLGMKVLHGRYRGSRNVSGHDGIWRTTDNRAIVVEVKTTDAYRIDLDSIAGYRDQLADEGQVERERTSLLIVVGRQDTGGLEAQVRGSKHAWITRLLSVDALLRMLQTKEELEDHLILRRLQAILIPHDFTKLDEVVDLMFAAVEEARGEPALPEPRTPKTIPKKEQQVTKGPAAFHDRCISRIEKHLGVSLQQLSRSSYQTADGATRVCCAVSKYYERGKRYWFAFHPAQHAFLEGGASAYVGFACGSDSKIALIPFAKFKAMLPNLGKTTLPNRFYWHVTIYDRDNSFVLAGRKGTKPISLSPFRLGAPKS